MARRRVRIYGNPRVERYIPWYERLLAFALGLGWLYGALHAAMAGSVHWTAITVLCAAFSFYLASQKFWRMT